MRIVSYTPLALVALNSVGKGEHADGSGERAMASIPFHSTARSLPLPLQPRLLVICRIPNIMSRPPGRRTI